jgi:hypothetical protein
MHVLLGGLVILMSYSDCTSLVQSVCELGNKLQPVVTNGAKSIRMQSDTAV